MFGGSRYRTVTYDEIQRGGEIAAGSFKLTTVGDVVNRGGLIETADLLDIAAGGDVIN